MNNETTSRRISAISAFLAALLILASSVVLSMAVNFNFEFLENPADLITAGLDTNAVGLFQWGSILELLGTFILLLPVTLYLWFRLKGYDPYIISLATVFGLGSLFIGVIGATIRAGIFPSMMNAFPQTAQAQRGVLEIVFRSISDFTFEGLYATDSIFGGLWWLGIGLILRVERRFLGFTTLIMGIAIFGAGVGWLLHIDPLARLEIVYFIEPLWLVWLGIDILRGAEQREPRSLQVRTRPG